MIINSFEDSIEVIVDRSIYDIDVIHKCFYWYAANFDVVITNKETEFYLIQLKPRSEDVNFEQTASKIKRDLIDFKLRHIVTTETKVIRELIIAKAFANFEADEDPLTELTDPVGFDPSSI